MDFISMNMSSNACDQGDLWFHWYICAQSTCPILHGMCSDHSQASHIKSTFRYMVLEQGSQCIIETVHDIVGVLYTSLTTTDCESAFLVHARACVGV